MASKSIPVVSLKAYTHGSGTERAQFVDTVGGALTDLGFFSIEDHGVDMRLIDKAYSIAHEFFQLSDEQKLRYENLAIKGQRGYTSFGREHAKNNKSGDLKEFWHVGRELSPQHPLAQSIRKIFGPVRSSNSRPRFLNFSDK